MDDMQAGSILASIKKLLGLEERYEPFDIDIMVWINSALMTLTQMGVGPKEGFSIKGYEETWDDFLTNDTRLESAKTYVYLQTRMMFDPPTNSFVMDAMKKQSDELLWRLNVQAESVETFDFMTYSDEAYKRGAAP